MRIVVFLIITFFATLTAAPTPLGSNGIITVPSAYLYDDSEIHIGFKYESDNYPFYRVGSKSMVEKGLIAGFSFFPFLELSLRWNLKPHQDRLANIRVQVLKEGTYRPAVTIGFRDALTILRGINNTETIGEEKTSYYNSIYLVTGKTFSFSLKNFTQKLSLHLGGGYSDFENSRYQHLHGVFGGIEYQIHENVPLKLLADYDTKEFRFGVTGSLFNHAHLTISTLRFKEYAIVLTGSVRLNRD